MARTRSAAEAGDPKRQYELGTDYYFGTHGVPKDHGEAFKWLRKAGENGDGETQRAVAFIFQNDGSEGSEREAIYWYMKSGAQRNFLATSNLYSYCVSGKLIQQDCSDVLKWLRELAGSTGTQTARASCDLGRCTKKGLGHTGAILMQPSGIVNAPIQGCGKARWSWAFSMLTGKAFRRIQCSRICGSICRLPLPRRITFSPISQSSEMFLPPR